MKPISFELSNVLRQLGVEEIEQVRTERAEVGEEQDRFTRPVARAVVGRLKPEEEEALKERLRSVEVERKDDRTIIQYG